MSTVLGRIDVARVCLEHPLNVTESIDEGELNLFRPETAIRPETEAVKSILLRKLFAKANGVTRIRNFERVPARFAEDNTNERKY